MNRKSNSAYYQECHFEIPVLKLFQNLQLHQSELLSLQFILFHFTFCLLLFLTYIPIKKREIEEHSYKLLLFLGNSLQTELEPWQEGRANLILRHNELRCSHQKGQMGYFTKRHQERVCILWQASWMKCLTTTASWGFVWWLPSEAKASQRGSFQQQQSL